MGYRKIFAHNRKKKKEDINKYYIFNIIKNYK